MKPIKIIVTGATGRMGQIIIKKIISSKVLIIRLRVIHIINL